MKMTNNQKPKIKNQNCVVCILIGRSPTRITVSPLFFLVCGFGRARYCLNQPFPLKFCLSLLTLGSLIHTYIHTHSLRYPLGSLSRFFSLKELSPFKAPKVIIILPPKKKTLFRHKCILFYMSRKM
jgi:hypothetical protein